MLHVWKLQNSEDFRYFVRTARKTPVDGSLISLYLVAEKKELYIGHLLHVCKCKKGPSTPPPSPLEGHIKINDNLELYRFAKKGYIVSRGSLLVTVKS